jgi:hypothetical protein
MMQSRCRKRCIWIITAGAVLGIAIGMGPTVLERIGIYTAPGMLGDLMGGAQPVEATVNDPAESAVTPVVHLQMDRRAEQTQFISEELAAREQAVAAGEAVLAKSLETDFWKRQTMAAAATIAFTMLLTVVVLGRAMEKDGIRKRLRAEETRLRNLQLSVIGSLEEFEANLADARAWAAAEAQDRNTEFSSHHIDKALQAEPFAETANAPLAMNNAFSGEDEMSPMPALSSPAIAPVGNTDESFYAPPAVEAPPLEQPLEQPFEQALEPIYQNELTEALQQPVFEPQDEYRRDTQNDWPERFVAPPQAVDNGPWGESVRRSQPMPAPVNLPEEHGGQAPGMRGQIEYLAAEGYTETDIARQLGVSRDEVRLALRLGAPKRTPQQIPVTAQSPDPGWQSREWEPNEQAR